METFSGFMAFCAGNSTVAGEFPAQRLVTRRFDVFFDLCPNKWLSKQWRRWWFETPSRSLWRHCNDTASWEALTVIVRKVMLVFQTAAELNRILVVLSNTGCHYINIIEIQQRLWHQSNLIALMLAVYSTHSQNLGWIYDGTLLWRILMIYICCETHVKVEKVNQSTSEIKWNHMLTCKCNSLMYCSDYYTLRFNEVERGVYWFHLVHLSVCLSVRLSVCLWTESCPLCIFNYIRQIHSIFAHLIKQLQKVCRV